MALYRGWAAGGDVLGAAATKLYAGLPCPTSDCRIALGTPITVNTGATTAGIDFSFDAAPLSAVLSGRVVQDGSLTPLGGVPVRALRWRSSGCKRNHQRARTVHSDGTARGLPGSNGCRAGKFRRRVARRPMYRVCRHIAGCRGWSRSRHQWARFLACARRRDLRADCVCGYGGGFYSASGDQRVQQRRRAGSAWGVATRCLHTDGSGLPDQRPGRWAVYLLARDAAFVAFGIRPSGGIFIDKLYGEIPCAAVDCDVRRGAPVTVTAGGTTTGVDFGMTKGASSDFGGFGSGKVSVFDDRGVELTGVVRSTFLSFQQIVGLPPGTYFIKSGSQLHSGITCHDCPPTSGTPIVIRPGDLSFPMTSMGPGLNFGTPPVRRIGGTIADAVGAAPLSTIAVDVVTGAGQVVARAVTDMFGRYSVGPLAPGTYYVRTSNDRGYVDEVYNDLLCATCDPRTGTPVTVGAGSDVAGIDFALAAGGIISGAVADTDDLPLASIPVSLFSGGGALAGRTTRVRPDSFGSPSLPAHIALARKQRRHMAPNCTRDTVHEHGVRRGDRNSYNAAGGRNHERCQLHSRIVLHHDAVAAAPGDRCGRPVIPSRARRDRRSGAVRVRSD